MTTRFIDYCSFIKLSCAWAVNKDIVLCLQDAALVAQPEEFCDNTLSTIDATICQAFKTSDSCLNVVWHYTFQYDSESLANPDTPLATSDITGVFCKDCLTTWVEEHNGHDVSVVTEEDGSQTLISEHGCEYPIESTEVPFTVTDTNSVNLTVNPTAPQILSADVKISADGGNTITIHADGLFAAGGGGGDAWLLIGNAGTIDGTNFAGTTDAVPYNIRVNNFRAFRIQLGDIDDTPSLIGGCSENFIDGAEVDAESNVICGGGFPGLPNFMSDTGSGGSQQCAIVGGADNGITDGSFNSFIGAGNNNRIGAFASESAIVAGTTNLLEAGAGTAQDSFIGGGSENTISNTDYGVISGGRNNNLTGADYSAILGGRNLKLTTNSVGYQADTADGIATRDLSAFVNIGYFGDIDLWIGNTKSAAKRLLFFEPNADLDYSSANYSSFKAQAQGANIDYIWPAAAGTAGQQLTIDTVVGTVVTLKWA